MYCLIDPGVQTSDHRTQRNNRRPFCPTKSKTFTAVLHVQKFFLVSVTFDDNTEPFGLVGSDCSTFYTDSLYRVNNIRWISSLLCRKLCCYLFCCYLYVSQWDYSKICKWIFVNILESWVGGSMWMVLICSPQSNGCGFDCHLQHSYVMKLAGCPKHCMQTEQTLLLL